MAVWDLGGTRNDKQLEKLAAHPQEVMESSRFLGQVEVPLADTLVLQRGGWLGMAWVSIRVAREGSYLVWVGLSLVNALVLQGRMPTGCIMVN